MTVNRGDNLHQKTPEVTVLDNRGLTVRELRYHRHPNTPTTTDERITRHRFTLAGQLAHSIDPRLFDLQQTDSTVNPNMVYETALTGEVVRIRSVDAGNTLMLNDITGRPVLTINAIEVTCTWQYEHETLPGRPLSITEQPADEAACITERFVWAGNSQAEKNSNLSGQCVRHYDTAGLNQTDSIALNGIPLSVTRQLLPDGTDADWQGDNEPAWNDRLAPESFTTLSTADATSALLTSTDAMGNVQRLAYDVAGLPTGSWLRLAGGTEQVIVKSLTYSAAGQKLREEHGNGVVTTYTYEPETQRLVGIKTERPPGHAQGAKVLQDLRYEYDPVGNVLRVTNDAEATRFWRNQKVVPENTYSYDSLYQLVTATGREMANIGQQSTLLPTPSLIDSSTYSNYSRTYNYDRGDNLTQIRHSAPASDNSYTTKMTVSDRSNRAVLSTLTENPAEVDVLFTAGGQQNQLLPGQNLVWTPRGELLKVAPVVRNGQVSDQESYRYDADNQRIIKTHVQQTANSSQAQSTLYLPGLERHTTTNGTTVKEVLHVITVGEAGRAQVRVLHWEAGKPSDISNDQVRYSYDNLIGSSGLEVDGDGQIISMEEYYPYGGTAVWMARNRAEADYKTVRYSGKERDATGLYYYGYRYYQPWAGRWLSADPAGTVDGLNLYTMVRNNPATFRDKDGLIREGQEAFLPVSEPHTDLDTAKEMINKSTQNKLQEAQEGTESVNKAKPNAKQTVADGLQLTKKKLKDHAAHSVVISVLPDRIIYKRQFFNLPGSLSKNNLFPGVELTEGNSSSPQSYKVINAETFLNGIQDAYSSKKIYPLRNQTDVVKTPEFTETPDQLHPVIKERIIEHLEKNKNILPTTAGIAGLHAEVQALNFVLHRFDALGIDRDEGLANTYIYTKRLVGKERNVDFPACHNCSGILSGREKVMTGRVPSHTH
ncbi:RHS repeat protein [Xenorhabdus bovienii]|uniref:RHS repeat-associated core domain-containing protein n=1 Tax=Xenorhabdus bovienii TaxID=40576 RepID=UPI001EDF0450|nr:RHS repeat-associated core domain-containing protein [Xenorhabdus bovienii]MCG3460806.1 RHS repeat protein [Xenorhabdus bovienii]